MSQKVKWGILGCGKIAKQFAVALQSLVNSELVAVASRTSGKAKKFADEFSVNTFYSDYLALIENPQIDVIYIANCNTQHEESARLCIENGKAVLCEKPLTADLVATQNLIEFALKKRVFLMEGMWMRFHPAIRKAYELVKDGVLGDIKMIKADFGYQNSEGILGRQLNRNLGGGATLDVGVYVLHFASLFFSEIPTDIASFASIGETNVDEYATYLLRYSNAKIALLSSAVTLNTTQNAEIIGTKGRIFIPDFWRAEKFILRLNHAEEKIYSYPHQCNGFEYEIEEVNLCITNKKTQSDVLPLSETLLIATCIDQIHTQLGIYK